jgi:hypothetical protein
MKKIAVASALMIFLSLITVNAEGSPSNHVAGPCAVGRHPVKHANKKGQSMRGAFTGAYQR